ncbi:MAG TPA: ArsR family transcriptional regulator, partial [Candidatus Hydrogenedentes bacterium]|nr:ArsR family transcriptional regulator [Candidatus Hydrogenedentota bacterium]
AGALWLEVFVLADTTIADIEHIQTIVKRFRPDRIQLNTAVRPPAEAAAQPASPEQMAAFAEVFGDKAEVIADFGVAAAHEGYSATRQDVVAMLQRRPCSADDVAAGLGIHRNEVAKHLGHLLEESAVHAEQRGNITYYLAAKT